MTDSLEPHALYVAHQAPLSMGFCRQETELPCLSPGDLPNPGLKPRSSALQADSLLLSHRGSLLPWGKSITKSVCILTC